MLEWLLIPISFWIDQKTKNIAEAELDDSVQVICKGKVRLSKVYNEGAFLGFLGNHKSLLMGINIIAVSLLAIVYIFMAFTKGAHLLKAGAALMIGGALGNIYDRIVRKKVVDFFSLWLKPSIYYNIADFCVFIGGFLIVLGTILKKK